MVIGVLCVVSLALIVPDILALHHPIPKPQNLDIGTYGLVGLLQNAVNGIASVVGFFAPVAAWILTIAAVLDVAFLGVAVVLYFTGGGIGRRATWARVIGILTAASVLLIFFPGLVWALHGLRVGLAVITAAPFAVSLYTLWVLIWRFE